MRAATCCRTLLSRTPNASSRGLGVIHLIDHVGVFDTEYFIRKHILPGGRIPSVAWAIEKVKRSGFEVLDVENLRGHYALTLDCWAERFDRNWEAIGHLTRVALTRVSAASGAAIFSLARRCFAPKTLQSYIVTERHRIPANQLMSAC